MVTTTSQKRTLTLVGLALVVVAIAIVIVVLSGTSTTRVPNVVGEQQNVAVSSLNAVGLRSTLSYTGLGPGHPPAVGSVIAQTPSGGSSISSGGTVKLVIFGSKP